MPQEGFGPSTSRYEDAASAFFSEGAVLVDEAQDETYTGKSAVGEFYRAGWGLPEGKVVAEHVLSGDGWFVVQERDTGHVPGYDPINTQVFLLNQVEKGKIVRQTYFYDMKDFGFMEE